MRACEFLRQQILSPAEIQTVVEMAVSVGLGVGHAAGTAFRQLTGEGDGLERRGQFTLDRDARNDGPGVIFG